MGVLQKMAQRFPFQLDRQADQDVEIECSDRLPTAAKSIAPFGHNSIFDRYCNQPEDWHCGAAPITAMMSVKDYGRASGSMTMGKPVVHHATVDLRGKVYELLKQNAAKFLMEDVYRNPGPLQFDGPGADSRTVSLLIQDLDYMGRIKELNVYLDKVRSIVKLLGSNSC